MDVQFIVFLTLSTLIYRGTDISKGFSKSLGIRDNESRLYIAQGAGGGGGGERYTGAGGDMCHRIKF